MTRVNFERLAWIFMRVSGFLLIALVFTHLTVNLMQPGGVHAIDFAFVAGKLADPFWQWFDVTMLWLALIHGTNGMRVVIEDYVYRPKLKRILLTSMFSSTVLLIILGTLVVFTLDPCPAGAAAELLPSFCATQ